MKSSILIAAAIAMTACTHAPAPAPAVAADPARGVRNLTADSAEVLAIAMEAANEIRPSGGMTKALFGGVFVNGHRAQKASDEVIHSNGFASASGARPPKMTCTLKGPNGQQTPMQCPRQAVASAPPIYTFEEVVATPDSAYVGVSEVTPDARKGDCITLRRTNTAWSVVSNTPIGDAKRCGK